MTHGAFFILNYFTKLTEVTQTARLALQTRASSASFLAGQWVDFFIPGVEQVGGYSMCSAPSDLRPGGDEGGRRRRLDLAVKASTWAPAAWMHDKARVGDVVQMRVGESGTDLVLLI